MRRPRFRFTVRRMMVTVLVAAFLSLYVGSYYRLSRRGMAEAPDYGIDGFLYVPANVASTEENQARHFVFVIWYTPLNWIDHVLFGSPRSSFVCWIKLIG